MAAYIDSSEALISEFEAMCEEGKEYLTKEQVYEMMIFQGVLLKEDEIKKELHRLDSTVDQTQFVTFMQNLGENTRKLREIFAKFIKVEKSTADKADIVKGLEEMGINNAATIVSKMTSENNRITYKSFLQVYLKGKSINDKA